MKTKNHWIGLLAITLVFGMTFAACNRSGGGAGSAGSSGRGGTFTLTDIPAEYNGKYAWVQEQTEAPPVVMGGDVVSAYSGWPDKNTRISNGKVIIPMWSMPSGNRYIGNDTISKVAVIICEENSIGGTGYFFDSVTFSNGSVTKSWNNGHK